MIPEPIRDLFYPEAGGDYLVALESKAPAIVPSISVDHPEGVSMRIEPQTEVWGKDNPEEGLFAKEVVTGLLLKTQVKASDVEEALTLGGDVCYKMLTLLSLQSNTSSGDFYVRGVLDVTQSREKRGILLMGPFVNLPAVRTLKDSMVRSGYEQIDIARRSDVRHQFSDAISQYFRGLGEKSNPAEFLAYYLANDKLGPLLKKQGMVKREREGWKTREVQDIRNNFVHAITKGDSEGKGSERVIELGEDLAQRARKLLAEAGDIPIREDYLEIDKNHPVQPSVVGFINDREGVYDSHWSLPTLVADVEMIGVNENGVFGLDLKNAGFDTLPGTSLEIIGKGFQTGGRFVRPAEI